ncbi:MAG: POTRA domain-containing protein [Ferruginibacter sp.]
MADFKFEGVKNGDVSDLKTKVGLVKDRVVTENMKQAAIDAIQKFYTAKGYRNVAVQIKEENERSLSNAETLTFIISKGNKVRVNSIIFQITIA